jgi:lipopolysaccharide cholinephosphotransferase
MQELTLKELQQVSLNILKDVHAFCVANNITYSIAYGTLIGALRHKGFIPWDDDVDIVMPRPDFERFCKKYKSDKLRLIYYGNDKTALAAFARVVECDETDYQTERPWTVQRSGVWIDIFPLDGILNQEEYSKRYSRMKRISWFVYKFRRQNHHIVFSDSWWSKTKTIIAKIIGLNGLLPSALLKLIVAMMTKYDYDTCAEYGQMSCLDDGPIIFSKEDFQDTVLLDFEDTQFYAMNGYDKVLRQVYGDYMQMPPEDKRVPKQYWIKFYWKD